MKMLSTFAVVVAGSFAVAQGASADVVAYWDFNDFDTSAASIAADQGSGTLNMTGWGGNVASFGGTSVNALPGVDSGGDLALQGGSPTDDIFPGNGTFIEFVFSMNGMQSLELSFATRGSGTGFDVGQWSYSTDGASFTDVGSNTVNQTSTYLLREVSFGNAADDAGTVWVRYTLDGATSSAGNARLDNILFEASAIPAPGALALLGLAGLVGVRGRRRA